ncbi:MAG: hypothetical protein Q8P59_06380, partial [Dehalococcoidia bacterium]|nr:hypothetical protein [Dehalococcoidia bacterium]
ACTFGEEGSRGDLATMSAWVAVGVMAMVAVVVTVMVGVTVAVEVGVMVTAMFEARMTSHQRRLGREFRGRESSGDHRLFGWITSGDPFRREGISGG